MPLASSPAHCYVHLQSEASSEIEYAMLSFQNKSSVHAVLRRGISTNFFVVTSRLPMFVEAGCKSETKTTVTVQIHSQPIFYSINQKHKTRPTSQDHPIPKSQRKHESP